MGKELKEKKLENEKLKANLSESKEVDIKKLEQIKDENDNKNIELLESTGQIDLLKEQLKTKTEQLEAQKKRFRMFIRY